MHIGSKWPKKAVLFSLLIVSSLALLSGLMPLLTQRASADTTSVQVIDKAYMEFDGKQYKDSNPFDELYEWRSDEDCQSIMKIENFTASKPTATVEVKGSTSTKACATQNTYSKVPLAAPEKRHTTAYRIDADNIMTVVNFKEVRACGTGPSDSVGGDRPDIFRKAPVGDPARKSDVYYQVQGGTPPLKQDLDLNTDSNGGGKVRVRNTCAIGDRTDTFDVSIAHTSQLTESGKKLYGLDDAGQPTATIGNSGDDAAKVDCTYSVNPLTWIMCPLVDLTQTMINGIGRWIQNELEIDADSYFHTDNDTGKAIYAAWNSVRMIAMSLLVIIGLVMVVAQALSLDIVDAYTVRKVLPRLLIAVIAISLSWQLTALAVQLSNDLALAVRTVIITPFKGAFGNADLSGGDLTIGAAGIAATGLAVAAGFASILGLLLVLASAAVALLIAMVCIILRQMLVVLLVILAPVAILAYILPGTQKGWKIWHEGFSGALLVYPIITGFIAIGAVFGQIASHASTNNTGVGGIIAVIATYAPYFLIPKAFQMAGGLVANLTGAVNDRSKGVFDRLKNARQAQHKRVREQALGGNRWKNLPKSARDPLNKFAQTAQVLPKAGLGYRDAFNKEKRDDILKKARTAATVGATHEAQKDNLVSSLDNDDMALESVRLATGHYSREKTAKRLMAENGALYGEVRNADGTLDEAASATNANRLNSRLNTMTFDEARAREHLKQTNPALYAGDHNAARLNSAMTSINVLRRRYGDSVVADAAFERRGNSSTAYLDEANTKMVVNADGSTTRRTWTVADMQVDAAGKSLGYAEDEHGRKHYEGELMYEYDAEGEKIYDPDNGQAAGKMLAEALAVSHGDFEQATSNAMKQRAAQDRAGRHDVGGGGAGDTLVALTQLANGQTDIEGATAQVVRSMAKGKTLDEAAQGGKSANARAAFRGYRNASKESHQKARKIYVDAIQSVQSQLLADNATKLEFDAIHNDEVAGVITPRESQSRQQALIDAKASAAQKAIIQQAKEQHRQEAIRIQAQEQMAHAAFARTSQEATRISGNFFAEKVQLDTLPDELRLQLTKRTVKNPAYISEADTPNVPRAIEIHDNSITSMSRNEINDALRDDETWRAYTKEYGASQAQAEQARAAAAAGGASAAEAADAAAAAGGHEPGT